VKRKGIARCGAKRRIAAEDFERSEKSKRAFRRAAEASGKCESTHEADTCCVESVPGRTEAEALMLAPFGRARVRAEWLRQTV
jgi:hypothetical protein